MKPKLIEMWPAGAEADLRRVGNCRAGVWADPSLHISRGLKDMELDSSSIEKRFAFGFLQQLLRWMDISQEFIAHLGREKSPAYARPTCRHQFCRPDSPRTPVPALNPSSPYLIFIELLLCARHCSRCWGTAVKMTNEPYFPATTPVLASGN